MVGPNKIQVKSRNKSKLSKFVSSLAITFHEYSGVSSITGLKYVKGEGNSLPIKIFWCIVIISCFVFCNILVAHFWLRYKSNSTRMTVASNHVPLSFLKLPAITFCPVKPLDTNQTNIFVRTLVTNTNQSQPEILQLLKQTAGWFSNIKYNANHLEALQRLMETNRYAIGDLMNSIQRPCEILLAKCRFEQSILPCSSLFNRSLTQFGNCCSFNRNQELRNSVFIDPKNTLSVIISPDAAAMVDSEGIKLLIHESGTVAGAFAMEKILPTQSEISVRLKTVLSQCSPAVDKLPISERNCLHPDDRRLKYFDEYREINCKLECVMRVMIEYCNCLPYFYAKYAQKGNTKVCDLKEIKCLNDNYWSITGNRKNYSLECDCMANCADFSYEITSTEMQIHLRRDSQVDPFYSDLKADQMIVHISFGSQVYKVMQKDLATNILALTANLGGIYSLFIGFSGITFIEIIYYFCVRSYLNYRKLSA